MQALYVFDLFALFCLNTDEGLHVVSQFIDFYQAILVSISDGLQAAMNP
jgi:hypothetical protein